MGLSEDGHVKPPRGLDTSLRAFCFALRQSQTIRKGGAESGGSLRERWPSCRMIDFGISAFCFSSEGVMPMGAHDYLCFPLPTEQRRAK